MILFSPSKTVLSFVILAFLASIRSECSPEPFPIGVDTYFVYFYSLFGTFWKYDGNEADDIGIYCTRGCSNTFNRTGINDTNILDCASRDSNYFLIHGYTDSMKPSDQGWMKKTAMDLACKKNATVYVVDWHPLAVYRYDVTVNDNLRIVADYLTEFIEYLKDFGIPLNKINLIGHSLGAHICGLIGKNFGGKTIEKIIAIDPAGPLIQENPNTNRLAPTDAKKTVCLYTNPNGLGIGYNVCDGNFWPNQNNGSINPTSFQPGCPINDCSHGRSIYLLYSSIFNNLIGTKICRTTDCIVETETFGIEYSGKVGDFNCTTSDCYPFIN